MIKTRTVHPQAPVRIPRSELCVPHSTRPRRSLNLVPTATRRPRTGFTLLELLTVIGLIAFLTALVVVVAGRGSEGAKINATKATLTKISNVLQQRRDAFGRLDASKETQYIRSTLFSTPPISQQLAEIIAKKELYRSLFPQNFVDTWGPDQVQGQHPATGLNDDSPIAAIIARMENANPPEFNRAVHDPRTESSELLYLALTQSIVLGTAVNSDIFNVTEVMDTDEDGLLEFVDGWQQPLHFYRWPTRLIRPASEGNESNFQSIQNFGAPTATFQHPVHVNFANYYGSYTPNDVGVSAAVLMGSLPSRPPPQDLDGDGQPEPGRGPGTQIRQETDDPLAQDADDPLGGLSGFARWLMRPAGQEPRDRNGNVITEARYHTPVTYHLPLIVSAGPDGILGLQERSLDTNVDAAYFTNYGHLAQPNWTNVRNLLDNVTNLNLQAGSN